MSDSANGEHPSHRILTVTEEELSRIILDIHDGPVQYLFTALSLLTGIQQEVAPGRGRKGGQAGAKACAQCPTWPAVGPSGHVARILALRNQILFRHVSPTRIYAVARSVSIVEGLVIQHEEWTGNTVELTRR